MLFKEGPKHRKGISKHLQKQGGLPGSGDMVLNLKEHQVLCREKGRGKEVAFQSQETTWEKGDTHEGEEHAWEKVMHPEDFHYFFQLVT